MSESPTPDTEVQPLVVNGQYVKDLSFEAPGTPAIFAELQGRSPNIPIQVDLNAVAVHDNLYEVTLHLRIEAHLDDKRPVFLVELAYAGLFSVSVPAEHLQPVLLIECPRLLFPFARAIIADLTRDGGFPPLMIQPIDFVQLYRNRMESAEAEAQSAAANGQVS